MAIHSFIGLLLMAASYFLGTKARPFIPLPKTISYPVQNFYVTKDSETPNVAIQNYATSMSLISSLKNKDIDEEVLKQLKSRFAKKYETSAAKDHHNSSEESELVIRLTLLQMIEKKYNESTEDLNSSLFSFYKEILINPYENWIIKRQALKNSAHHWPTLTQAERDSILSQVDARARALWHTPDSQLVQDMLSDAK